MTPAQGQVFPDIAGAFLTGAAYCWPFLPVRSQSNAGRVLPPAVSGELVAKLPTHDPQNKLY